MPSPVCHRTSPFDLSCASVEMKAFIKSRAVNQFWLVLVIGDVSARPVFLGGFFLQLGSLSTWRGYFLVTAYVIILCFLPERSTKFVILSDLVFNPFSFCKNWIHIKKCQIWIASRPHCWFEGGSSGRKQEPSTVFTRLCKNPWYWPVFFFSCAINEKFCLDCTPSNINQWEPHSPSCTIGCK